MRCLLSKSLSGRPLSERSGHACLPATTDRSRSDPNPTSLSRKSVDQLQIRCKVALTSNRDARHHMRSLRRTGSAPAGVSGRRHR